MMYDAICLWPALDTPINDIIFTAVRKVQPHRAHFHETNKCSNALRTDLVHQISLKSEYPQKAHV